MEPHGLTPVAFCERGKYCRKEKLMDEQVKTAIEKIRPLLQRDGGDIELVSVEGGVVKVQLKGACCGCPMSQMTLQSVVEETLKKEVPGIERVEAV